MMSANTSGSGSTLKLDDVIDIVRNESTYTKRMEELSKATQEANESTNQLTKAKDLDAALKSARQAEQVAQSLLKEARDKVIKTEAESREAAERILNEAKDRAANLDDALATKRRELTSVSEQCELLNEQLSKARGELVRAQAEANTLREKSSALREQIKEKQAALAALLGA